MAFSLEELEAKLKANPFAREFFDLAAAYQKLGRIEDAKKICEKGLEKFPGNFQARLLMTQIYIAEGKFKEARQQVEKVLMVVPDNITANHLAADISFSLDDKEAALRFYKVVELFEPGRQGVSEKIAELEFKEKEPEPAEPQKIEDSAKIEENAPNLEEYHQESAEAVIEAQPDSAPAEASEVPEYEKSLLEPAVKEEEPQPLPPEIPPSEDNEGTGGEVFSLRDAPDEEIGDDTLDSLLAEANLPMEPIKKVELQEESETDSGIMPLESLPEEEPLEKAIKEVPPPPDEPEDKDDSSGLSTLTIAELYEKQGYPEKAIEVYQHILLKEPERKDIRLKIEKLKNDMLGLTPEGEALGNDIKNAIRRKRIEVLGTWLRKIKEEGNV
jgi:tetratricopeptide (TPR) repeat protein